MYSIANVEAMSRSVCSVAKPAVRRKSPKDAGLGRIYKKSMFETAFLLANLIRVDIMKIRYR